MGTGAWGMSAGVVVGDLNAVAEIGELWGEAEREFGEESRSQVSRRTREVGQLADARAAGRNASATQDQEFAGKNARATRGLTGKRRGEIAEAAFVAKVAELGFGVAKPWDDSDPFDFIVHSEGRLWRVQVKSAHRAGEDGAYSFHAHGHALRAYGPDDIDVLVAYVVPENAWYVFPLRVVRRLRSLKLFSGSQRRRSKFEKYREAWWVFEEPVVGR